MLSSRSTFSLLGDRYLDTQFNRDHIDQLERELARRGIVGLRRWVLELVAAGGLWWNVIWWHWCSLDERDVRLGWGANAVVGGVASVGVAYCFGFWWALLVAAGLLAFAVRIGLGLRSGTVAASPEA